MIGLLITIKTLLTVERQYLRSKSGSFKRNSRAKQVLVHYTSLSFKRICIYQLLIGIPLLQ